jgi:hypothetical protein
LAVPDAHGRAHEPIGPRMMRTGPALTVFGRSMTQAGPALKAFGRPWQAISLPCGLTGFHLPHARSSLAPICSCLTPAWAPAWTPSCPAWTVIRPSWIRLHLWIILHPGSACILDGDLCPGHERKSCCSCAFPKPAALFPGQAALFPGQAAFFKARGTFSKPAALLRPWPDPGPGSLSKGGRPEAAARGHGRNGVQSGQNGASS